MIDIKSNKKNSFFLAANPPQGVGHPTVASHIYGIYIVILSGVEG